MPTRQATAAAAATTTRWQRRIARLIEGVHELHPSCEPGPLLLQTGEVDVNARSQFGQSILQTCFEPELITLFIENGARTDVQSSKTSGSKTLFDQAVMDALHLANRDRSTDRTHSLARMQIYSRLMSNSIRGHGVEPLIRDLCAVAGNSKRERAEQCAVLAGLVDAAPGTFGN